MSDDFEALLHACARLRHKGLMQSEDSLSWLLPDQDRLVLIRGHLLNVEQLTTPSDEVAAYHAAAYRQRPDIEAAAWLSPPWTQRLAGMKRPMPTVFDEQARHIGATWRPVPASSWQSALLSGANAGIVDGRLWVMGITLSRLVFNVELWEKCAHAYWLAECSGDPVRAIPWWVAKIAGHRLRKDQRRAAANHLAGERAEELVAY